MSKKKIFILLIGFIGLGIYFFHLYAITSIFDFGDEKTYSKDDLINNYKNNKVNINALTDYFNKVVPVDRIVEIEFKNDKEIDRLAVTKLSTKSPNYSDQYFCEWNLNIKSIKVDSIIKSFGWTLQTLAEVKEHLDKANCIGITNGEPTIINFKRNGFGMYSYDIFLSKIPDNLKKQYDDSCRHILYNENVSLEYGGGAIGPQCFPGK